MTGKKRIDVRTRCSGLFTKKAFLTITAILITILLVVIAILSLSSTSIVGVWMSGTSQVIFTEEGSFKTSNSYGTYTIGDDKMLTMSSGEYSYLSGRWEYKYGSEAKEDSNYWYVSGNTLYFRGNEYTKK